LAEEERGPSVDRKEKLAKKAEHMKDELRKKKYHKIIDKFQINFDDKIKDFIKFMNET
jgi:hypothetical protein